ncbi:MAG: exodeoxyribonuclease III [Candidatus Cloacimonetes bacterium]|nr:exodeoxyribonuclease III [Candidatus Cloacimonadota bacterium]
MKIVSFNVNGLRAILKKDFLGFIEAYKPDILGLQETKIQQAQIPNEIEGLQGYHKFWDFAEKAGYSGTCLLSKDKPKKVSYDIGDSTFSKEGRIILAEYDKFALFNIYFPNGKKDDERLKYKLGFYDQFLVYIEKLRKKQKNIIVMGDFNTAHQDIDLTHPKANEEFSGFLPIERAWIDSFISKGYVDTFRYFDKNPLQYSWWTYRLNARQKNVGWRIDYCFVTTELMPKVKSAFIWKDVFGSDHCPVGIEIK